MTNTDNAPNPRAVPGGNEAPDWAKMETDRLVFDYAGLVRDANALIAEAKALAGDVQTDEQVDAYSNVIKRIRDVVKRIESHHSAEKEPHLRRGQAADQFFFGLAGQLARRKRGDVAGAADELQDRLNDFVERKRAEELRKRQEEERLAREEAERLRREQAEKERIAREALEAAERARKAENIEAHHDRAAGAAAAAQAIAPQVEAAEQKAEEARVDALRPTADMVRTRTTGGTLLTGRDEPYAVVEDRNALDKAALWPFLTVDAIDKALRAWAKTTGHRTQMAGAKVGFRPKASVR